MTILSNELERITLPSGDVVYWRESDHSYWRLARGEKGSGRLTGVSTVVGPFDWRPDNLMRWAARLEREGVAALAATDLDCLDGRPLGQALSWLSSAGGISDALKAGGLDWESVRRQAASRGTNVHLHALHALSQGQPVPAFAELTDEERGYARGVVAWWARNQPTVICAEQVVADLETGVAGRLDLLCELPDGRIAVVDCKTSRHLSAKFVAQLAGYARLALLSGFPAAEVGIVLAVDADGGFRAVEVPVDHEDFLLAVRVYRRAGELRKVLA